MSIPHPPFLRPKNIDSHSTEPSHPALCVITNHPAKYRDPKTGLPYYNSYAYREIQRVYRGDYKWSRLVGAWVGRGDYAARGVPEWFLDPSKAVKPAEPVLVPVDGAVELKDEVKGKGKESGEPSLGPVEEAKPVGGAEPVEGAKPVEGASPAQAAKPAEDASLAQRTEPMEGVTGAGPSAPQAVTV